MPPSATSADYENVDAQIEERIDRAKELLATGRHAGSYGDGEPRRLAAQHAFLPDTG